MAVPLAVHRVGEGHVGVGEGGENVAGGGADLGGAGQQLLLGLGEDVFLAQPGQRQVAAVFFQSRAVPVKLLQLLIGDSHQLWALKGHGGVQRHQEGEALALHGLVGRIGSVLIGAEHRVDVELLHPGVDGLHLVQVLQQRLGGFSQPALVSSHCFRQRLAGFQLLLPRRLCGEDVLHGPAVLRVLGAAHGDFFQFHTCPPSAACGGTLLIL